METNKSWIISIQTSKERMKDFPRIFPLPSLISFGITLILYAQIYINLNYRLGHPAHDIKFETPSSHETSLWISMSLLNQKTVITTQDRRSFIFDHKDKNLSQYEPFLRYLTKKKEYITYSAALAKRALVSDTEFIVSLGSSLQFKHLQPLLYCFAKAGIATYSFEVRKPLKNKVAG